MKHQQTALHPWFTANLVYSTTRYTVKLSGTSYFVVHNQINGSGTVDNFRNRERSTTLRASNSTWLQIGNFACEILPSCRHRVSEASNKKKIRDR